MYNCGHTFHFGLVSQGHIAILAGQVLLRLPGLFGSSNDWIREQRIGKDNAGRGRGQVLDEVSQHIPSPGQLLNSEHTDV
jgi:hypothetical protein